MNLTAFCTAVNELDKADCDRINADPRSIFGAEHIPLPESMLEYYYTQGYTPAEAYFQICQTLDEEGHAEALAS